MLTQRTKSKDVEDQAPTSHVVDVDLWLDRAVDPNPVRSFTPAGGATYVPRHRKEPQES